MRKKGERRVFFLRSIDSSSRGRTKVTLLSFLLVIRLSDERSVKSLFIPRQSKSHRGKHVLFASCCVSRWFTWNKIPCRRRGRRRVDRIVRFIHKCQLNSWSCCWVHQVECSENGAIVAVKMVTWKKASEIFVHSRRLRVKGDSRISAREGGVRWTSEDTSTQWCHDGCFSRFRGCISCDCLFSGKKRESWNSIEWLGREEEKKEEAPVMALVFYFFFFLLSQLLPMSFKAPTVIKCESVFLLLQLECKEIFLSSL